MPTQENKNLKRLHTSLVDNPNVKFDVSFDQFAQDMYDDNKRNQLHQSLTSNPNIDFNIPYERFNKDMGFGQPIQGQPQAVTTDKSSGVIGGIIQKPVGVSEDPTEKRYNEQTQRFEHVDPEKFVEHEKEQARIKGVQDRTQQDLLLNSVNKRITGIKESKANYESNILKYKEAYENDPELQAQVADFEQSIGLDDKTKGSAFALPGSKKLAGALEAKRKVSAFKDKLVKEKYDVDSKYEGYATRTEKEFLEQARRLLENPSDASGLEQFWNGLKSPLIQDQLTVGLNETMRYGSVLAASKKAIAGEPITEAEENLLKSYAMLTGSQEVVDTDLGYDIGSTVSLMIPYMAQFALTSGVGTGVRKAVSEGLKTTAKPLIRNSIGYVAGAAAQAPLLTTGYTDYLTRRSGNYEIDDKGDVQYLEGSQEGVGEAAWKSYATAFAEVFGEGMGEVGKKLLTKSVTKKGATGLVNQFKKAAKYDGPLWETAEEYITSLTAAGLTGETEELDHMFTRDGFLTVFVPTLLMGGAFKAAEIPSTVRNRSTKKKFINAERNLNDLGDNALIDDVKRISELKPEDQAKEISKFGNLDPETKGTVLDYIGRKMQFDQNNSINENEDTDVLNNTKAYEMIDKGIGEKNRWSTNELQLQKRKETGQVHLVEDVNGSIFEVVGKTDKGLVGFDQQGNREIILPETIEDDSYVDVEDFNSFINEKEDQKSTVEEAQKETYIANEMNRIDEEIIGITHENGEVVEATTPDGRVYNLMSGPIENIDANSQIIGKNKETGKKEFVNPTAVTIASRIPADQMAQDLKQQAMNDIQAADQEINENESQFMEGQEISFEGKVGAITDVTNIEEGIGVTYEDGTEGYINPEQYTGIESSEVLKEFADQEIKDQAEQEVVEQPEGEPVTEEGITLDVDEKTKLGVVQNEDGSYTVGEEIVDEKAAEKLVKKLENLYPTMTFEAVNNIDKTVPFAKNKISIISRQDEVQETKQAEQEEVITKETEQVKEKGEEAGSENQYAKILNEAIEEVSKRDDLSIQQKKLEANKIFVEKASAIDPKYFETYKRSAEIRDFTDKDKSGLDILKEISESEFPDMPEAREALAARGFKSDAFFMTDEQVIDASEPDSEINFALDAMQSMLDENSVFELAGFTSLESISTIKKEIESGILESEDSKNMLKYLADSYKSRTLSEQNMDIDDLELDVALFNLSQYDGDIAELMSDEIKDFTGQFETIDDLRRKLKPDQILKLNNDVNREIKERIDTRAEASERGEDVSPISEPRGEEERGVDTIPIETDETLSDQIKSAEQEVDLNPTEAQKKSGNYKKGHVTIQGMDVTIENPKGSVRSGIDSDGESWEITMNNTYGYIKETTGFDEDHIDIFLGPNPESNKVFVVDQIDSESNFDEHKVMIGFNSIEEARAAYLSNYEEGWQGLGAITETTVDKFKDWSDIGEDIRKVKPFSEYSKVREDVESKTETVGDFLKEERIPKKKTEKKEPKEQKKTKEPESVGEFLAKKVPPRPKQQGDALDKWVFDNSNNPDEIYTSWLNQKESTPEKKLSDLERDVLATQVKKSSFIEFSDKNEITAGIAKEWFVKKNEANNSHNIDVIAQDLSETYNREVTPNEIVDIIIKYPSKDVRKTTDLQNDLARKYKDVTGESITKRKPEKGPEDIDELPFKVKEEEGSAGEFVDEVVTTKELSKKEVKEPSEPESVGEEITFEDRKKEFHNELSGIAKEFTNTFGVDVIVVEDEKKLPKRVQNKMEKKGIDPETIPALFDPTTGNIYIMSNYNESTTEAKKNMLHEAVGHKGLRGVLGNKLGKVLDDVYNSIPQDDISRLSETYGTNNPKVISEEYIAEQAELGKQPSFVQKAISEIRAILRRLFNINYTNADIANLLRQSASYLQKQKKESPIDKEPALKVSAESKLNQEIKDKEKELSDARKAREKKIATFNERRGLFGDTQTVGEMLFEDTADFSQENLDKFVEAENNQINRLEEELRRLNANIESKAKEADSQGILFKTKPSKDAQTAAKMAADVIDSTAKNRRDLKTVLKDAREIIQDRDLPIKNLEKEVKKRGGIITDDTQPYRDKSLSFGRVEAMYDTFREEHTQPIYNIISKWKDTKGSEIMAYQIAKHGIERNREMRKDALEVWQENNPDASESQVNDQIKELEKRDFSGVSALDDKEKYTDNPDRLAQEIINEFEKTHETDEFWNEIKGATSFVLDRWLEGDQITKQQHTDYTEKFDHFVPLRGWHEAANKILDYKKGQGITGKSLKRAEGRTSLPDNPLIYIEQTAFQSIGEQVSNEVNNSMMNLIIENYKGNEDLFRVQRVYHVKNQLTGEFEPTIQAPTKEMFDKGDATTEYYDEYKKLRKPSEASEHEVWVQTDNGTFAMVFPEGQLDVAQALNNQNDQFRLLWFNKLFDASKINEGLMVRGMGTAVGLMKRFFTSWNPVFPVTNLMRDWPEALSYIYASRGAGQATDYFKTLWGSSFKTVGTYLYNRKKFKPHANKSHRLYKEFREDGGMTGFTHQKTPEEIQRDISRAVRRANKTFHAGMIFEQIERFSQLYEDATRFAAYVSARNAGESRKDSASLAKEVTVNFNRKGKLSKLFDSTYAFFNVAIQAAQKNVKLAKDYPKRFAITATSWVILGGLMAELNRFIDDDDYEEVNEWVKQNYMIIPAGDRYVRIPLPQFFRSFYSMGVLASDVAHGDKTVKEALGDGTVNLVASLSPIDPGGFKVDGEWSFSPLVPTFYKPIHEITVNRNFMGGQIYREPFTKQLAEELASSRQNKANVNPILQFMTDALYSHGGGRKDSDKVYRYEDGKIKRVPSITDINPSKVEHLIKAYTGGIGKFVTDLSTSAISLVMPEETVDANTIPYVNSFIRKYPEKHWSAMRDYYNMRDYMGVWETTMKTYKDSDRDRYSEMRKDQSYKMMKDVINPTDRKLDRLRDKFDSNRLTLEEYIEQRAETVVDAVERNKIIKAGLIKDYEERLDAAKRSKDKATQKELKNKINKLIEL